MFNFQTHIFRCRDDEQRRKLLKNHMLVAGCASGLLQAVFGCPIEVVKIKLQTLGFVGRSFDCMKIIYRHEGLYGLYRGLVPMIWRDVLPYGIFLYVYDWMYELGNKINLVKHARLENYNESGRLGRSMDAFMTSLASFVATVLSWSLVAPLDCIKTLMQAEMNPNIHKTMHETAITLLRDHSYRAFFRGTSMIIAKAYAILWGYQYSLKKCQLNAQKKEQEKLEKNDEDFLK